MNEDGGRVRSPQVIQFLADRPPRRWEIIVGLGLLPVVALLLRLAYIATLSPTNIVTFEADPITYDQIARNIVAGRGFSGASFYYPPGSDLPTSFWDPLYPYFLALIYAFAGPSIPAVRVVQAVIGAASVGMVWQIGNRIDRPAVGLLAAGWMTIYPFFFYYTGQLLTETLFIGLILLTVATGLEAMRWRRMPWFIGLGIAGGLASLGRAEALAFTLGYVPWCAWSAGRVGVPIRTRLAWVAAGWLALGATMAPWTIRNLEQFGRPIVTTTKLGYNLYKYYHPMMTADQTVRVVPFPDLEGLEEPERADRMQALGFGFMAADPPRTAEFMLAKFLLLFKLTPTNDATRGYAVLSLLSYGVLLPFMAVGFLLASFRGMVWWPVIAYVAGSVASKTAVFSGIRLRMQIEPFLLLFAAVAVTTIAGRMTGLPTAIGNIIRRRRAVTS